MLIKNDFLSHWKTKLLCKRLGDGDALRALLSLWAYCEQRRAWRFALTPLELAGVCDFGGDQDRLYHDLVELRFITVLENGVWEVNGWGEMNASLVAKWPGRKLSADEFYHPLGYVSKRIPEAIAPPIAKPIPEPIGIPIGLDRIGLDKNPPIAPQGADVVSPPSDQPNLILQEPIPQGMPKKERGAVALEIYEAFPKKVGKDAALKAIERRLKEGLDGAMLLAKTQQYAQAVATWPEEDRQFVPHPSTWFNQGRFDDDALTWRRFVKIQAGAFGGKKEAAARPVSQGIPEPAWDWRALAGSRAGLTWGELERSEKVRLLRAHAAQSNLTPVA